ncbi:MAG: hypothetical protein HN909_05425 [Phycisphaerales bacterium]|jgi:hypothetical protein|nr:hypothetical protein [Phycisphaerales bacterium]MBT7171194.1 hypothetical protein [Phycisphaerales bacterium]
MNHQEQLAPTDSANTAEMPYQVTVPAVVSTADIAAWFGITRTKAYQLLTKMRAAGLKTIGMRGRYFSADVRKFATKIG